MPQYSLSFKAARMITLRAVLASWPECPSALLAGALGVNVRTIQRDIKDLAEVTAAIEQAQHAIATHHDPAWLTDAEVMRDYGYSAGYLPGLAKRLPSHARGLLGNRRLWLREALDEYQAGRIVRQPPRARRR
jgi:hypothetical protein